jgi:opacity protein-like surface antigen
MKAIFTLVAAAAAILLAGCSTASVRKPVRLDSYQHIFVEQRLNENQHLDEMMVDELKALGRDASSGPLTMMPDNADAVLSYDARWNWDFKTYLLELNLSLRAAHSNKKLADARYYQPSLRTKAAPAIVHELIVSMFGK